MEKIILDTDIGSDIDDAFCLAYLLKNEGCDLLGVTTVSGKPLERAEIASAIMKNIGRETGIYPGTEKPLIIDSFQPEAPQYAKINNWEHDTEFESNSAVTFLRKIITDNPGQITLLAVGPLTNVGILFAEYPETAENIKELVIMGGEFYCDDEAARGEWNIYCDPHAAEIVFKAPVKKMRCIGLDVTTKVEMMRDVVYEKCREKALEPVVDFARVWLENCDRVVFHDPLAATVIFNDGICEYERGDVKIMPGTTPNSIHTVFTKNDNGRIYVASKVNPPEFFKEYFNCVKD